MFFEQKAALEAQMKELRKIVEIMEHKCWYYKTALKAGTEDIYKNKKA